MKRTLDIIPLLLLLGLASCSQSDYHNDWSYPDKPKTGIYKRNLEAISNPPELEFIEIISDSTYRYVYKNPLRNDTVSGMYIYKKVNSGNNNYAYIEFQGLNLPHRPNAVATNVSFTALYGSKNNQFYIDPSPELEEDLFVLK